MALSDSAGDPENAALGFALTVLFGEYEGGKFNWDSGAWEKPD